MVQIFILPVFMAQVLHFSSQLRTLYEQNAGVSVLDCR